MTVSEKPTLDALRELRALLEDPGRWTTVVPARDGASHLVDPVDPKACQWCLTGGVEKVTGCDMGATTDVVSALASQVPVVADESLARARLGESAVLRGRLEVFNDSATHAQVLDVIDRTLRAYEAVR